MNWLEIKISIKNDLLSRELIDPNIRLNALDNLEEILKSHFPDYIENPKEMFGRTDKNEIKMKIAKFKSNQILNSAESSIINEIYYRIK
jgi:bacillopeptidase F (M6 metalloprotease family)